MSQFPIFFFFLIAVILPFIGFTKGTANPVILSKLNLPEGPRPEYQNASYTSDFVYGADGSCAYWDGQSYQVVKISYDANTNFGCTKNFWNWSRKLKRYCGDQFYELRKQCILTKIFNHLPAITSSIISGRDTDAGLVFLDGCSVCNFTRLEEIEAEKMASDSVNTNVPPAPKDYHQVEMEIWFSYEWEDGSFFTGCSAMTKKGDPYNMVLTKNGMGEVQYGFAFAYMTFYQRNCQGMFTIDEMPEFFHGVKINVKHNCNLANQMQTDEIELPDVYPKKHHNHVVEMRDVKFVLHENALKKGSSTKLKWE